MNHFRLALIGAAAAVAYAAPGLAQDQASGKQVVEEVEIVHADHNAGAAHGDRKVEKVVKHHGTGDGVAKDRAALEARCGARKFETSAVSGSDQDKRQTRIKLCAAAGESQADWVKSLNGALARLEADKDLPPENKAKMIADLKAEIASLN